MSMSGLLDPFRTIEHGAVVACVDIGGTKLAVSLATAAGFLARQVAATVTRGDCNALGRQVQQMIDAACAEAGLPVETIARVGVASAGPFRRREAMIELVTPNLCGGLAGAARGLPNDWTRIPVEAPLRARFHDVRVVNDGAAALMAERRWGALQDVEDCAYVTWSTGVGTGLCVGGRVLLGHNGNAGHAGHSFVNDESEALCGCGNIGDVEAQIAGNAITRRFGIEPAALMQAARDGEAAASKIVDELCRVLGRMLYNLVAVLDLQRISLGGSVFWHHQDLLLPRLRGQLSGCFPALTGDARLVPAGLGNQVGDFGALALVA